MNTTPKDPEQLTQLFTQLKGEIVTIDGRNSQILSLVVTASGAILALGFNQDNPERAWMFLCVFIFLIPTYGILYGNRRHIWRISTYLRVFVEPHLTDFKWETRLDSLRKLSGKRQQNPLSSGITSNEFILVRGIGLIVLVALLINFVQFVLHHEAQQHHWQQLEFVNVLVSTLIGLVVFAVFFLTARRKADELKRNGRVETEFYQSWLAVQQAEARDTATSK